MAFGPDEPQTKKAKLCNSNNTPVADQPSRQPLKAGPHKKGQSPSKDEGYVSRNSFQLEDDMPN